MFTIATLDIGSSYLKSGIFEVRGKKEVRLLHEARKPHDTTMLFRDAPQYIEKVQRDIITLLQPIVAEFRPSALGISAYRESVVALDSSGQVSACGSNLDIDRARLDIDKFVVASGATVCSLPSWLAWRWTGALRCTTSDQYAIEQFQNAMPGEKSWPMPQSVPVGFSIGVSGILGQDIQVFLGGTDEQLSYLGAGLGEGCDLAISTGTFWTFSWLNNDGTGDPRIRLIPQIPPYPATASLIGYRWGAILYAARQQQTAPALPASGTPEWAFGDAVRLWRDDKPLSDVANAVKNDIVMVPALIGSTAAALQKAVVYGGGIRSFPNMRRVIVEAFTGMEIEFMSHDATLRGLAILASIDEGMSQ
jgi:hypothetical protein